MGMSPSFLARQSRGLWDIFSTMGSEDAKLQQETSPACLGHQAALLLYCQSARGTISHSRSNPGRSLLLLVDPNVPRLATDEIAKVIKTAKRYCEDRVQSTGRHHPPLLPPAESEPQGEAKCLSLPRPPKVKATGTGICLHTPTFPDA